MVLHKLKILGIPNKANYRLNNARVRYNSISSDEISFPIPKMIITLTTQICRWVKFWFKWRITKYLFLIDDVKFYTN